MSFICSSVTYDNIMLKKYKNVTIIMSLYVLHMAYI